MAHIVIIGAGLGGLPMAYEMRDHARPEDRITVIAKDRLFHFVPSNPWVAVHWRTRKDIEFDPAATLARLDIGFIPVAAARVLPEANAVELVDGQRIDYDYLIVATGPRLAFDEVPGLGPQGGHTQSICHVEHAAAAERVWQAFVADPGPVVVGAVQGASCFGPAYEFSMILETDLRRRKIRDQVPMTFVTSEPYIGHLGLGGVGDSKGMMESMFRSRHIKWICNAKVDKVEAGVMHVIEHDEDGKEKRRHELPFKYSMMLPAFKGVEAVSGIEGLVNPRGFVLIDAHQRNPTFRNVFAVGVCVAIPPVEATPIPTGTPKTGYMIESMVSATARNIRALLDGKEPSEKATWNAVCLADFGDSGAAFVALPQIPPRNVNWVSEGKWVHLAKLAFEKYFLHKMKNGTTEPIYEKILLNAAGLNKLRQK
ncbi:pyridine nucleotide-disulfide oxidoreductase [Denitratisoma sp. DHT3]|uniref:NAD(P)/FAD-dependent oxidoreductase n=1 Tax=Denitratisoma sp. DHT3 TaxID=1981880 RepID=UPI001198B7B7|nr:FAD/NAD(P)-binding oxidoreductase [Denitratisoma sp. DHT3]QDX80880.1 pyridine nucleotide-disulfide oxidoreductase [Denitratisoma sp. DHT3]